MFPWLDIRDLGLRVYMHVLRGVALLSDAIAGIIAAEYDSPPHRRSEPEIERGSE